MGTPKPCRADRPGPVCSRKGLPFLVAEVAEQIAGYAYASPYRPRAGYRFTLEDSVYLHPEFSKQGIGLQLLQELLAQCGALGYREMIAVIGDSANLASIRLHERAGFVEVGVFRNIGFKFGRYLDSVYMQAQLNAPENPPWTLQYSLISFPRGLVYISLKIPLICN